MQSVKILPEVLKPISWLAGSWATTDGRGKYPTIQDFSYHEVLEFTCIGQPMFNYLSHSKHPTKQSPMHQERGFLRIQPGTNNLALVVSHNFGVTTIEEGQLDPEEKKIKLCTTSVQRMQFAKKPAVTKLERCIRLISDNTLEVVVFMETENTAMTEHLRAIYTKQDC
ncbi:unnamed protein product [Plutella xylostella]|uniref:(diamondback moth) hypothetical protein n=1 Tax=Plutella xylostella TaxID=51655 RepID=A0A8S4G070_PLUXY|nr:unnamed protein product [Plutella xylostella]